MTTMKSSRGVVLPAMVLAMFVLASLALVGVARPTTLSLQQARYLQGYWWHWQQASWAFYVKHKRWPMALDEVALDLDLAPPSGAVQGFTQGSDFVIHLTGLQRDQRLWMQQEMAEYVQEVNDSTLAVVLHNEENIAMNLDWLARIDIAAQAMQSDIDLTNHHIEQLNRLQAAAVSSNQLVGSSSLAVNSLTADSVVVDGSVVTITLELTNGRSLESILSDFQRQYLRLHHCMYTTRICLNGESTPHPSIASGPGAGREYD